MRSLLIVLTVVGVAVAKPGFLGLGLGARSLLHAPVAYSSVAAPLAYSTVAAAPVAHHIAAPLSVSSQYHAQDELGQYSYGYAGGPSAKSEVKTFDGVTRGGYSYVDANGEVQNVNYVADAINGFRVAATNLPVAPEPIPVEPLVAPVPVEDTVEVAAAKQAHFSAVAEARAAAEAAPEIVQAVAVEPAAVTIARGYHPALAYGAVAPAAVSYSSVAAAPIAYSANVAPFHYSAVAPAIAHGHLAYAAGPVAHHIAAPLSVSSQYHAQDELGQYSYGYSGGPSAKSEVKTFDGVTRGGYSYVDARGEVQSVNYVADAAHGFRVAATNLPVAPQPIPAEPLVAPVPVVDTVEVAAAKQAHFSAVAKATNLPVAPVAHYLQVVDGIPDTVEVAAAKAQHYAAHLEAKARLHGLY